MTGEMNKKEMTVPNVPAPTDTEQPSFKNNPIITDSIDELNRIQPVSPAGLKLQTLTMTELYDTLYSPKQAVIENFLYQGVYLFVGPPKIGKSFFMAQMGYHVSRGLPLWNYKTYKGTVLYLALEDDYSRLQQRLFRMFDLETTEYFHFATKADSVNRGLEYQLEDFITRYDDIRLIIIDTLQKIRENTSDHYSYANDYEVVTRLKEFSEKYGAAIVLVHHTRKMESSDSFEMISGTNGLLGAADGAFVLQKKNRTGDEATLEVVGRDQPDQKLELVFDRENCVWNLIKSEHEIVKAMLDPTLEAVAGLITEENPVWEGTATELLALLPETKIQPNQLSRKLNVGAGKLWSEHHIRYERLERSSSKRKMILTLEQEQ